MTRDSCISQENNIHSLFDKAMSGFILALTSYIEHIAKVRLVEENNFLQTQPRTGFKPTTWRCVVQCSNH